MDEGTRRLVEDAYHEAVQETVSRGQNRLTAHKEGVVAAAMLLSALEGLEDIAARNAVVALNLRPEKE